MKKWISFLVFLASVLLFGSAKSAQVEDLAIAVVLGADLTDADQIEVFAEIPKITGSRGGESGGGSDSDHLIYSASGASFDEALVMLQWAVPRRLDLSQLEMVILSEDLARSGHCERILDTLMATPKIYTAAHLAVCGGRTQHFMETLKPVIGARLSTELTAAMEDAIRNGYVPDSRIADVYYACKSVYSDPLVMYAEAEQDTEVSALLPRQGQLSGTSNHQQFLGAAVFRGGKMVGRLSGTETLFCKILRGGRPSFPYSVQDKTVGLTTVGAPTVQIDLQSQPMRIGIHLRFSILPSSRSGNVDALRAALARDFEHTVEVCRNLGTEPFLLADKAAGQFLTMKSWIDFDWHTRFSESRIDIRTDVFENNG